jgi:hypothetical protein
MCTPAPASQDGRPIYAGCKVMARWPVEDGSPKPFLATVTRVVRCSFPL